MGAGGTAEPLLRQARRLFPFVERIIGDPGYQGPKMAAAVARTGPWKMEIVRRRDRHRFCRGPKCTGGIRHEPLGCCWVSPTAMLEAGGKDAGRAVRLRPFRPSLPMSGPDRAQHCGASGRVLRHFQRSKEPVPVSAAAGPSQFECLANEHEAENRANLPFSEGWYGAP